MARISHGVRLMKDAVANPTRVRPFLSDTLEKWRIGRMDEAVTDYFEGEGSPTKTALVSFLPRPLLYSKPPTQFSSHQNAWQAVEIAAVLNDLGYSVDVVRYDDTGVTLPHEEYDLCFGLGANFFKFSEMLPERTTTIFFGTGMHPDQQLEAEKRRIDQLNRRKGANYGNYRFDHDRRTDLSGLDGVVVIGDERTAESYRNREDNLPVEVICNPTFESLGNEPPPIGDRERTRFLWIGGGGLVLKGLDRMLEVFSELPDAELYVAGPIDSDVEFQRIYESELSVTPNIHTMGWVDPFSDQFHTLCRECDYLIYPSASDSSPPGSVVTCMYRGVVPVLPSTITNDVGDWGVLIEDCDRDTIASTVRSLQDREDTVEQSRLARDHANENFTRGRFRAELKYSISEIA